jgi:hypothetical protein
VTTALVPCPGCSTRYDLSRRSPGKRVRCPKCQGVLVVPEPVDELPPLGPEHTSSARHRRARGPVCRTHPRQAAEERCGACQSFACSACLAPRPLDHLCASCVEDRGLGGALPIDFGPLATPRRALGAFARALPRVLVWNIAAVAASALFFGIPIFLLVQLFHASPADGWMADLAKGLAIGCAVAAYAVHYVLVVPTGCAVFLDHTLRGKTLGFGAALVEAGRRALRNAGPLLGVIAAIALLILPFGTIVFGGAALLASSGSEAAKLGAVLVMLAMFPVVLLPVVTALGLSVPVVILEERSAVAALGRSWELVRPQLHIMGLLVVAYFLLQAIVSSVVTRMTMAHGLPPLTLLLITITDLVWPALLVTAYHGLVAAQLAIPGRK